MRLSRARRGSSVSEGEFLEAFEFTFRLEPAQLIEAGDRRGGATTRTSARRGAAAGLRDRARIIWIWTDARRPRSTRITHYQTRRGPRSRRAFGVGDVAGERGDRSQARRVGWGVSPVDSVARYIREGKIETRIHLRCRHGSVRHRLRGQRLGRYPADRRLSGHSQRERARRAAAQFTTRETAISESKRPRVAGGSFRSETRVIAAASSSRRSWRRATLSATSSMRISPRAVSLCRTVRLTTTARRLSVRWEPTAMFTSRAIGIRASAGCGLTRITVAHATVASAIGA